MPDNFGKRLKKLRTLLNMNQKEIGKQLEVPLTTISKYERGDIRPSFAFLTKMCMRLSTNINWLLTGNGTPFLSSETTGDNFTMKLLQIPLYDISKDFKKENHSDKKNIIKYMSFNINWLISEPKIQPKNLFLIKLFDHSMYPHYNPSDLIFIDFSKKDEYNDGLYLVSIGRRLFFRRIQFTDNDNYMIIADNRKYKTLYSDSIKSNIIGKAIWTSHKLHD